MATNDWIRGELDGDVHIAPPGRRIVRAAVSDASRVSGPPTDDDASELRQERIPGWVVRDGLFHPVTFVDARVRAWEHHAEEREDRGDAVGRVRGVVWAQLADPPPPLPREPDPPPALLDPHPESDTQEGLRIVADAALALVGAGLVWLAAGPAWAGVWAAVALAPQVVRRQLVRPAPQWFEWPLLLAQLGGLLLTLQVVGAAPCAGASPWLLAPLAVPLLLSGWLADEPLPYALVWTFGLVVWVAVPEAACLGTHDPASGWAPSAAQAVERAAVQIRERWGEAFSPDDGAQLVSEALPRMTVHQALRDPDRFYSECGQRVYLSGDELFLSSSESLRPVAAPHLRALRRLLAIQPDVPIVVEGHLGAGGHRRGEERARAVVAWMRDNTRFSPGRFIPVGYGGGYELVSDPGLGPLNRRIEVFVACR